MEEIKIITIGSERWQEYKELQIEAVRQELVAFLPTYEEKIAMPDSDYKDELDRAEKGEIILLFAEMNGKLVGMGGASFHTLSKMKHNSYLWNLFVPKDFRRKGIGMLLSERRIEEIKKRKEIKNIFCEIVVTQIASVELHKKLGFEIVGELESLFFVEGNYINQFSLQKKI